MGRSAQLGVPVDPCPRRAMAGLLLVNPRAGRARPGVDDVVRAGRKWALDVRVLRDGDDAAAIARTANADAIGVAGGGGPLPPVAAGGGGGGPPLLFRPLR